MQKFDKTLGLGPFRRRPTVDQRTRKIRGLFGFFALLTGLPAALYAYHLVSSYAVAIFVFLMVQYFVSRGVADVTTDPHKIQRLLFFALLPILSTAALLLVYRWWGVWWLSVLLGLLLGVILNGILGQLLFPQIFREEEADTRTRMNEAFR